MSRINILIVDDARSERVLLRHALTDVRRNLNILEAADQHEALACMHKHSLELVFLDIQLTSYSGIDLLSDMLATNPDLKVCMVSHHSTQELVVKALRLGAVGYVIKPFNLARLKEVLDRVQGETEADAAPI